MNANTSYEPLLRQLHKGKRSAFRELYDALFSPLCAFGLKYLSNTQVLEDFVQEAFISYWDKRNDFTHLSAIKSYLYTAVRNNCINHLRHEAVKHQHEQNLVFTLESDHYFENAVIEEETFNRLYAEIHMLPESTREIMLLALNGLKNPQIADELGISVNTVKTLKKNAYGKLRQKLTPALQGAVYGWLF